MMNHKLTSGLLILAVLLSGCSLPSSNNPTTSPGATTPRAWFDAPLPGSAFFPPNPICPIVAHGASPNGISLFELSVNGAVVASISSPDTASQLVTLTRDCGLSELGEYRLLLRVQDNAGVWSGFAETSLVIAEAEAPTLPPTEPTATATDLPVPTVAPTVAPTFTATPSLAFSSPRLSTPQFYYQGRGCGDKQVTFGVTALSGAPNSVFLFYRLKNKANDETGAWSLGTAMLPSGGGDFSYILQGDLIPGTFVPSGMVSYPVNYTVQYQFVGTDTVGNELGKSVVYGDLTLSWCDH
jgi:hypothetical protein